MSMKDKLRKRESLRGLARFYAEVTIGILSLWVRERRGREMCKCLHNWGSIFIVIWKNKYKVVMVLL